MDAVAVPVSPALVLTLALLFACFLGALCGWAGGVGGRWTLRARLLDLERGLEGLDRRVKGREGQAGQAATQRRKTQLQERDDEADQLAHQLAAQKRRPRFLSEQDAEEAALAELDREAEVRGMKAKGAA